MCEIKRAVWAEQRIRIGKSFLWWKKVKNLKFFVVKGLGWKG
jgi:hypothetical protein